MPGQSGGELVLYLDHFSSAILNSQTDRSKVPLQQLLGGIALNTSLFLGNANSNAFRSAVPFRTRATCYTLVELVLSERFWGRLNRFASSEWPATQHPQSNETCVTHLGRCYLIVLQMYTVTTTFSNARF